MNSMRNLEKLGILVIVILVVVVGVVAITPGDQLDKALDLLPEDQIAENDRQPEVLPRGEHPDSRSANVPPKTSPDPLPEWPEDDVQPTPDPTPDPLPDPITVKKEPAAPPAPAAPKTYTVQKGDSFYRIAARQLGGAKHAKALMRANPSISPENLDVGDVLILPNLDGNTESESSARRESSRVNETRPRNDSAPIGPGGFYVVRNRDTLAGIAKRELGSSLRWKEIARLNSDVLGGTTRIVEGMRLRLPGARPGGGSIGGMLVDARNPAPVARHSGERTYTVKKRDTLSSIARSQLGKASRWKEIAKLNRAVLGGSHVIRPGIELQLPSN